ncbi:MAG: sugar transferase [Chloroflexota bacterium]
MDDKNNLENIQAVLLAAGGEKPLNPLTMAMPKVMAPVVNKPLLEHNVELLARHGVREVIVSLHHLPHLVERHFGDGTRWGVEMDFSLEREPPGSAGALRRVAHRLKSTFIVAAGDVLTDLDLTAALAFHRRQAAQATVVLHPTAVAGPGALRAEVDDAGRVIALNGDEGMVCTGISVLEPAVLERIPARQPFDLAHDLLPALLAAGGVVCGYVMDGYWAEIGSFGDYRRVNADALYGRLKHLRVPGRQAADGVWLGHNVALPPDVRIAAPVQIGDECQVRPGVVLGPETVLGRGVIVDQNAAITRSVVLDGTYVGQAVEVKEAVVNQNCLINVPSAVSVYVADHFMLGGSGEAYVTAGVRRAVDWLAALVGLILCSPLLALTALWLRLTSGRPVLLREPHVVRDPRSELLSGQTLTQTVMLRRLRTRRADGRDLPGGRFLRRWAIDLLPRLLDVMAGRLALVGVRPLEPQEAACATEEWHQNRYQSPAGLTGLWLIQGGESLPLEEQFVVDSYYAATRSWRQDRRILLRTPAAWLRADTWTTRER